MTKTGRVLSLNCSVVCIRIAIAAAALLLIQVAEAQNYSVIHSFTGPDGSGPDAGVVADTVGNLYGTTEVGGTSGNCLGGCGVVYQMTKVNGAWTQQVIHNFQGTDGQFIYAPVTLDQIGNVLTAGSQCTSDCIGAVVELTPQNGTWTETILHAFTGTPDGSYPASGLLLDSSGTLYGAAATGGPYGNSGTVFTLSGPGYSEYTSIFAFTGLLNASGAAQPAFETLTRDGDGNLYGTTQGTDYNLASIFELSPNTPGGWSGKVLYRFRDPQNGTDPEGGLTIDAAGNLYGATYSSGPYGYGVIYKLAHNGDGMWSYSVIYGFQGGGDGAFASGAPTFDAAGSLYGTTEWGGTGQYGTVFKLTPTGRGQWTETVLHSFANTPDGTNPQGSKLWLDSQGNIYGTTLNGGSNNRGTVFEITP